MELCLRLIHACVAAVTRVEGQRKGLSQHSDEVRLAGKPFAQPQSIPITRPAPLSIARSIGTLFESPPSTNLRPRQAIGGNKPGNAVLARMASIRSPSVKTMVSPVSKSVVTTARGIRSSLKDRTGRILRNRLRSGRLLNALGAPVSNLTNCQRDPVTSDVRSDFQ